MVNVDLSPATILGTSMVLSGLALYQVRASKPWLSRDYDVVISSIAVLTGGIIVFQGWRLDPILLFGQLLTAGTAIAFATEVLQLRQKVLERDPETLRAVEERDEYDNEWSSSSPNQWRGGGGGGGGARGGGGGGPRLPLPERSSSSDRTFGDIFGDRDSERGWAQSRRYDYGSEDDPAGPYGDNRDYRDRRSVGRGDFDSGEEAVASEAGQEGYGLDEYSRGDYGGEDAYGGGSYDSEGPSGLPRFAEEPRRGGAGSGGARQGGSAARRGVGASTFDDIADWE